MKTYLELTSGSSQIFLARCYPWIQKIVFRRLICFNTGGFPRATALKGVILAFAVQSLTHLNEPVLFRVYIKRCVSRGFTLEQYMLLLLWNVRSAAALTISK